MATSFQYSHSLDGDQIRILSLVRRDESILYGTLEDIRFDRLARDSQHFGSVFALSYCWGTEEATETLMINDQRFMVRPNLHAALKQALEYTRENLGKATCSFWIDAICINQDDNTEKAVQIDRMADIYSKLSVLIWLGEEAEGSDGVIGVVRWLELALDRDDTELRTREAKDAEVLSRALRDVKSTANISLENLRSFERFFRHLRLRGVTQDREYDYGEHWLPMSHPWWNSVFSLFFRPWFSRVWTVQEAVLPRSPMVLCGTRALSWPVLKDCRARLLKQCIYAMGARQMEGTSPVSLAEFHLHLRFAFGYDFSFLSTSRQGIYVLRRILLNSAGLHASHPKDHIYRFLGLANSDVRLEIRKDYSDSYPIARVFEQAVEMCSRTWETDTRKLGHLFWVMLCKNRLYERPKRTVGLASWCPDFASNGEGHFGHRKMLNLDDLELSPENRRVSDALATRWTRRDLYVRYAKLIVSGFHVDTILNCSSINADPPKTHIVGAQHALQWAAHVLDELGGRTARDWLVQYFQPRRHHSFQPATAQAALDALSRYRQMRAAKGGDDDTFARSWNDDDETLMKFLFDIITRNMGRFFFNTTDGRLGWSLQACKPGQILGYFPMGHIFHILEPVQDPSRHASSFTSYKHSGLAFIHGLGGDGLDCLGLTDDYQREFHIL